MRELWLRLLLRGHSPLLCTEGLTELATKFWRSYYCVKVKKASPPPLQLPHPHYSLEWSARRVRCHRPSTLSHMTLKSKRSAAYWFACVRDSKLWLAFAAEPAPLHTSLNCVARKFSANCARINQRFLSTGTSLLCLLKKLWKEVLFQLQFLYKNSSCLMSSSRLKQVVE